MKVAPIWISLYHYAWFISFGISAVCYAALMLFAQNRSVAQA